MFLAEHYHVPAFRGRTQQIILYRRIESAVASLPKHTTPEPLAAQSDLHPSPAAHVRLAAVRPHLKAAFYRTLFALFTPRHCRRLELGRVARRSRHGRGGQRVSLIVRLGALHLLRLRVGKHARRMGSASRECKGGSKQARKSRPANARSNGASPRRLP